MNGLAAVRFLAGAALFLSAAQAGFATNRTVTNLSDSNPGSLRSQIAASANGDSIDFAVTGTIVIASELLINKNLTINGPGASIVTVTRSGAANTPAYRIFDISNGSGGMSPGPQVTISGLTISNGLASGSYPSNYGGGILNDHATLTLNSCTLSGNKADVGGGVANVGILHGSASLTVSSCTFSNNSATSTGGGIDSDALDGSATLIVTLSTFNGNNAGANGGAVTSEAANGTASANIQRSVFTGNFATINGGGRGGAIHNSGTVDDPGAQGSADMQLIESTLAGNSAVRGGAVYNISSNGPGTTASASLTVSNCTLSSNTAFTAGGAVYNECSGPVPGSLNATASIFNCTFAQNLDSSGGSSIYNTRTEFNGTATVQLGNNIFQSSSTNLSSTGAGASFVSSGFNLSSDSGSGLLTGPSEQLNTDPQFDPSGLQYNGGPTPTLALTAGSPALDKGNSFAVTIDQRQSVRPYDNPSIPNASGGDGSDIGAYEAGSDPIQSGLPSLVVNVSSDHDDGSCGVADCTLREAINVVNIRGSGAITFAPAVTGTITLQQNLTELDVTGSATITGPGARLLAVSGGENHRVFGFNSGTSTVSGLTIRDGFNTATSGGVSLVGGAIYTQAALTMNDCMFTNNYVQGGNNSDGLGGAGGSGLGGVFYNAGTLSLHRCTFYGPLSPNIANGGRGSDGSGATISGGAGGDGAGGAIFNAASGVLVVDHCTFLSSQATGGNGGNAPLRAGGNGGAGRGAAICNLGTMTVDSATLRANHGFGSTGGTGSHGSNGGNGIGIGGLAAGASTTNTVRNTIVAGNIGANGGGMDVDGIFTSTGYNLIGTADHSTGFTNTGDQAGTDASPINAFLGSLQNNGGPTDTMLPFLSSPAIDKGKSFGNALDQRGYPRTIDSPIFANATGGDGSDIGAAEFYPLTGFDSDGDGMSDDFENFYGLNPNNPADANLDADGDGMTNLQEYKAGTSPLDPNSGLRITAITRSGSLIAVNFTLAVVTKSYRLERKDAITDGTWGSITGLSDFSPATNGSAQITDPAGAATTKRFYRIRLLP